MKVVAKIAIFPFLLFMSGVCFSSDSVNLIFLPDPSNCHQAGIELGISNNIALDRAWNFVEAKL